MKPDTIKNTDLRHYSIVPIRAIKDKEVQGTFALSVLCALCSYCDELGRTFVSQERLAKDLNRSRQSINRQIKKLMKLGYIVYARKQFKKQTTNTLKVIYDKKIKTVEKARETLTAKQQMDLAEREHKLSTLDVAPVNSMSTSEVSGCATSDVSGCATSDVSQNGTYNNIYNTNRDEIEKIKKLFCRGADNFGLYRFVNSKDDRVINEWVNCGYDSNKFKQLIEYHVKHCKEQQIEYPVAIGYFNSIIKAYIDKGVDMKFKGLIKKAAKGMP